MQPRFKEWNGDPVASDLGSCCACRCVLGADARPACLAKQSGLEIKSGRLTRMVCDRLLPTSSAKHGENYYLLPLLFGETATFHFRAKFPWHNLLLQYLANERRYHRRWYCGPNQELTEKEAWRRFVDFRRCGPARSFLSRSFMYIAVKNENRTVTVTYSSYLFEALRTPKSTTNGTSYSEIMTPMGNYLWQNGFFKFHLVYSYSNKVKTTVSHFDELVGDEYQIYIESIFMPLSAKSELTF